MMKMMNEVLVQSTAGLIYGQIELLMMTVAQTPSQQTLRRQGCSDYEGCATGGSAAAGGSVTTLELHCSVLCSGCHLEKYICSADGVSGQRPPQGFQLRESARLSLFSDPSFQTTPILSVTSSPSVTDHV